MHTVYLAWSADMWDRGLRGEEGGEGTREERGRGEEGSGGEGVRKRKDEGEEGGRGGRSKNERGRRNKEERGGMERGGDSEEKGG